MNPEQPGTRVLESRADSAPVISIVRIIARLNIGGPARHAIVLAEGLRDRGFESLLVYGSVDTDEGSFETLLRPRPIRHEKIPRLGRQIRPWTDLHVLYQLTRLLYRERPDVVHTHTAKAGTVGRLAALLYNVTRRRSKRCIVVHTFHGHVFSGYFGPAGNLAVRVTERMLARITDRIVAISESQRRDLIDRYRIAPAWKTAVIELGIELGSLLTLETNTTLRVSLGFTAEHVVFGFVGRLVPIKDVPCLLEAFRQVIDRVPAARLMIVGDGPRRADLEQLADTLALTPYVRFTGWQHDLCAVYGAMDVGVLSSRNEGTPVTVIEAMAAGKPVVATAVGGVQDVIQHDATGLVVPPADPAALAAAMIRLAQHPAERHRLGRQGRVATTSRFTTDRLLTGADQLYWQALSDRRRCMQRWPTRPERRRRIRVVSIIARLNIGGPARHAIVLAEGLRDRGFESLLVYGSVDTDEGSFETLLPSRPIRHRKIAKLGRRIRLWHDLRALYRLTRILFRERPDVVHTHTAKAGTIGRIAALFYNVTRRRAQRCIVVHTFHGHVFTGYFGPAGNLAVRITERMLARITDRIVAISESQRRDLIDRYRIAPAWKTAVIELGIELGPLLTLEANTALRESLGFTVEHVVFGYVGRLVPIKDVPCLLEGFRQVIDRVPAARLMIVGDGPRRADLEQLADTLALTPYVRFTGWQHDLAAVYGAMDVGVLSSRNEGTPVALIEAMAAGKPVVATAVGGVEDVIHHDVTGLVVPAGDPAALAAAMTRLAEDPAERDRLGRQGRVATTSRFSTDRTARRIGAFYERLLAETRRPASPPRGGSGSRRLEMLRQPHGELRGPEGSVKDLERDPRPIVPGTADGDGGLDRVREMPRRLSQR
jgi:glycosyltransferase involved in cell wall biosynthesis